MNALMGFDPAQFSILFPIGGVDFNILELLIWAAFICGVAFFWRKAATSWSTYFGALAIVAGVALVTVIETTQFMTLDEGVITTALLDPTSRAANQLHSGAFKVGMLGALPATIALQSLGLDGISIKMALKALWWLAGNLALVVMAWTVVRLAKAEPKPAPLATAATYAALAMLPTAQLAIKTVNYDLVSSIAGATSLFLVISYLWTGAPRAGWAAFALAILAASEKLTAGAILIAAIAALALRPLLEEPSAWVRVRRAAARGIAILALFVLVSAFILLLLSFLLPAPGQRGFWRLLLDPISTWIWFPVLRFVTIETVLEYRVAIGIAACVCLLAGIVIVACILPKAIATASHMAPRWERAMPLLLAAFVTMAFVAIAGAVTVQPYWAPFHPAAIQGIYLQSLNGAALHVGATTVWGHLIGILVYAVTVLCIAVPTPIWIAGLAGSALLSARDRTEPDRGRLQAVMAICVIGALSLPILAALAGLPFAHRYFNINIFLLCAALLLPAIVAFDLLNRSHRFFGRLFLHSAAAALLVFLVIEVWPFRPLFAAYRPFWLEYGDADRVEPGRLNASWMGWGEDFMRAGKNLEAACIGRAPPFADAECKNVTLAVRHQGEWLPGPREITVRPRSEDEKASNDKLLFYEFGRLYLIQEIDPIPAVEPDYAASYRGYSLGWVFRADRLAQSGYIFDK
jgi:hypothetical protein